MEKFEYAYLTSDRENRITQWTLDYQGVKNLLEDLTNVKTLEVLNNLGKEGWEVVTVESSPTVILLKRKCG